ncbi:hypothetical protein LINPERHAP1_LOCUS27292 [Linum perenne]
MDRNFVGWRTLLTLIGRSLAPSASPEVGFQPIKKSFAEAASVDTLSRFGACASVSGSNSVIEVLDSGVAERIRFLEKGLVFRLESSSSSAPDWQGFRRWAAASWGVAEGANILSVGDELWLLCCSSKSEVERIINLDRWCFPNHRTVADKWLDKAGTSNVCENRGVVWVTVKGLPLHLRSDAIFREVASRFGSSARCDAFGCDLNEFRIRTEGLSDFPSGFWVKFRKSSFWLSVVAPGSSPVWRDKVDAKGLVRDGRKRISFPVGKGKGKVRWGASKSTRVSRRVEGEPSSTAVAPTAGEKASGVCLEEIVDVDVSRSLVVDKTTGQKGQCRVVREEFRDSSLSVVSGVGSQGAEAGLKVAECGSLLASFWADPLVGLEAQMRSASILGVSVDSPSLVEGFWTGGDDNVVFEEGGHWALPSVISKEVGQELPNPKTALEECLVEQHQELCVEEGFIPVQESRSTPFEQAMVVLSRNEQGVDVSSGVIAEEELSSRCLQVAQLLDIRTGSSPKETTDLILESVSGALSRRKKTKKERELQRINWSDQGLSIEEARSRSGYVSKHASNVQS